MGKYAKAPACLRKHFGILIACRESGQTRAQGNRAQRKLAGQTSAPGQTQMQSVALCCRLHPEHGFELGQFVFSGGRLCHRVLQLPDWNAAEASVHACLRRPYCRRRQQVACGSWSVRQLWSERRDTSPGMEELISLHLAVSSSFFADAAAASAFIFSGRLLAASRDAL